MFPLGQGQGGGDGLDFVTGAEVFQFSSNQIPSMQKVSGILGMWVDATDLETGKNLVIQTPTQTFVFAGGNQGYVPITCQMPFSMKVSTTGGGTGQVYINLYNYNPLFTGSVATATPTPANSSGSGNYGNDGGSPGGGQTPPKGGQRGGPTF